jgi:hypothetical protein
MDFNWEGVEAWVGVPLDANTRSIRTNKLRRISCFVRNAAIGNDRAYGLRELNWRAECYDYRFKCEWAGRRSNYLSWDIWESHSGERLDLSRIKDAITGFWY